MNLITLCALAAFAFAGTDAPAAPAKDAGVDAKKILSAKCATCHAKDGKGNPMMAKMFNAPIDHLNWSSDTTQKLTDEDIKKIITDGKSKMPSFKGKLKDDEIAAMVGYIRSLAAKTDAKPADAKPAEAKTDTKAK